MTAFLPPFPSSTSFLRPSPTCPTSRLCSCRRTRSRPRRPPIHATSTQSSSYATDLISRTKDIDPASTDALQAQVDARLAAATHLTQSQLEAMTIHLADARGMARLGLVEAFGRVGGRAVPTLLAALERCPNPVVRRSCGKALAKIGDARATDALLHALVHDDDTVTRSSAAGALARMGSVAVPSLLRLISDPEVSMTAKGHAAWAIAFMQGDAGAALFDSLQHPNRDVRIAVVSALGAVAIGDALPTMAAISDDDWGEVDVKKVALRERAVEAMRRALADESAEVRAEAATALANAGCVEDAQRIADLLGNSDAELRRCAALALMKLGDPAFVGRLVKMAEDKSEVDTVRNVARLAANSLRRAEEEQDEWNE